MEETREDDECERTTVFENLEMLRSVVRSQEFEFRFQIIILSFLSFIYEVIIMCFVKLRRCKLFREDKTSRQAVSARSTVGQLSEL